MSDDERASSGIGHPRATFALFGHAEAEAALLRAYRSSRIHHAWLIGGPQGIGKATLAYRFARFVLAHPDPAAPQVAQATSLAVDPANETARRIVAQGHPDLLALERTLGDTGKLKTVIAVDQVRQLVPFFGSTAGAGGWRVAIIDPVDDLNEAGENALLKLLEEPPARALLLLIAHTPGRVRATIRSRCRKLWLRPLAETDVAKAAALTIDRTPGDPEVAAAASAAEGSVARAIGLMDADTAKFRTRLIALLDGLPDVDARALHALGDALAVADQSLFEAFIDTVNGWLAARLRVAGDRDTFARIAGAWDAVNRAAALTQGYNLDRRPMIFDSFAALAQAARR
ncbi:MAG: DNA polymerase III subunit delta' [Pseudorhodoplanes sp.]|nr:hypothetical protein [Pseudorhodoplanes sp.]MBW7949478.1 DNA polymerase III subunit delta' [Pseudorhodoplanes sp.]MCL4710778.1 DNA polymerase III subunit delta' [Pseudorhodoplanes sp.]MCQ3942702.1 DNA polymerase III subunit delta' [Alphaproteobacteria bacterium]